MSIPHYMAHSQAGLRFIAQSKIYNTGNFERLQSYVETNYAPEALASQNASERIQSLKDIFDTIGRIRIVELINADKHRTVVILQSEHAGLYYGRLKVDEDYPHLVTQFILRPHGT